MKPDLHQLAVDLDINIVLLADARNLGCRIVHTEVETRYASTKKSLLERLYDRTLYASAP